MYVYAINNCENLLESYLISLDCRGPFRVLPYLNASAGGN